MYARRAMEQAAIYVMKANREDGIKMNLQNVKPAGDQVKCLQKSLVQPAAEKEQWEKLLPVMCARDSVRSAAASHITPAVFAVKATQQNMVHLADV